MRRRDFTALAGAAAAWPIVAGAQQGERMRRIGVLLPATAGDSRFQTFVGAFLQALAQSGWTIGRNVQTETRWATANAAEIRRHAAELAALAPDVILAHGDSTVGPMLQATRTVPVVFPAVADPVGAGYVDSLARPGGNATGFMNFEYSMGAKWLELLKEIAPAMTRVAVLRDLAIASGTGQYGCPKGTTWQMMPRRSTTTSSTVSITAKKFWSSGGSARTIYADPAVNYAFRAWHDWCHWNGKHDLTDAGEVGACQMQCHQLYDAYGFNGQTLRWTNIIKAEVIGQAEYFDRHYRFPDDQRLFVTHYLANPEIAFINPKL